MSTDDRIWVANGTTVTGMAPGRPDITWGPVSVVRGITVKELKRIAALQAAALNADGEPQLSTNEQTILDIVLTHQKDHDYPCPIGKAVELSGMPRQTVSQILDRLVEKGRGTRPPKNTKGRPVLHRPFEAHTPAVTR